MGERSLADCVEEQLEQLRSALRMHPFGGMTLQDWYDDGATTGDLVLGHDTEAERGDTLFAWGYLNGCADHCDLTILEYVHSIGLSLDSDTDRATPIATKPKRLKSGRKRRALAK